MVKDMYTFEEVGQIPLKDLFALAEFIRPKQAEIAARQEKAMLEAEMTGNSASRRR